jgi:hypothetical protein
MARIGGSPRTNSTIRRPLRPGGSTPGAILTFIWWKPAVRGGTAVNLITGTADSPPPLATIQCIRALWRTSNKGWQSWVMATSTLAMNTRPANPASQWLKLRVPRRGSISRIPLERNGPGFPAPWLSSAATTAGATNRLRRNSCDWSGAEIPKRGRSGRSARVQCRGKRI